MIYENFKNIKADRMVKAVIGMSREKFELLVPYFSVAYQEIQEELCQTKEIKRLPTGGRPGVFTNYEERLLVVGKVKVRTGSIVGRNPLFDPLSPTLSRRERRRNSERLN